MMTQLELGPVPVRPVAPLSDSDGRIIQVFFDGGCSPNPGRKYGSYDVLIGSRCLARQIRMDLGFGTNNEAEFEILESALRRTLNSISSPSLFSLEIFTDSNVVKNRMMGRNAIHKKKSYQEASQRMFTLAVRCLEITKQFKSFKVEWKPRHMNVARFGH